MIPAAVGTVLPAHSIPQCPARQTLGIVLGHLWSLLPLFEGDSGFVLMRDVKTHRNDARKEEVYTHSSLESGDMSEQAGHMDRHQGHQEIEGVRRECGQELVRGCFPQEGAGKTGSAGLGLAGLSHSSRLWAQWLFPGIGYLPWVTRDSGPE